MRRPLPGLAALLLIPALAACASAPAPEPAPPPAATAPAEDPAPAEAAAPAAEAAAEAAPEEETGRRRVSKLPPTTVVIGTASEGPAETAPAPPPRTLAEAAIAERRRRAETDRPPVAVINDKNLAEWASRGKLTEMVVAAGETAGEGTAGEGESAGAAPGEAAEAAEAGGEGVRDEAYWRRRALETRRRWREAVDRIDELEQRVADLRWEFYAEDDPYYRDSEIKPLWDRALDDLRRARQEARDAERDLETLIDEGHREGALPGWLREGIELEPEAEDRPDGTRRPPGEHQAIEPPVVEEPAP